LPRGDDGRRSRWRWSWRARSSWRTPLNSRCIARPEPFFGTAPETYSFPSGHALFSACFYGALAWLLGAALRNFGARAAIWAMSLALIAAIGLSRLYLGVHYPTDVIAGYLVAVFWITGLLASPAAKLTGSRATA
jgi:Membrane-associated phospholipid phosphatase